MRADKNWVVALTAIAVVLGFAPMVSACLTPGASDCTSCADDMCHSTSAFEGAEQSLAAARALDQDGAIVLVHVYNNDFSTNDPNGPTVDATVRVGDTVRWQFDDSFHSATSVGGSAESFDSGLRFSPGETFDHTFTTVGTFHYYCVAHGGDNGNGTASGMAGIITVIAVPEPALSLAMLSLIAPMVRRARR